MKNKFHAGCQIWSKSSACCISTVKIHAGADESQYLFFCLLGTVHLKKDAEEKHVDTPLLRALFQICYALLRVLESQLAHKCTLGLCYENFIIITINAKARVESIGKKHGIPGTQAAHNGSRNKKQGN